MPRLIDARRVRPLRLETDFELRGDQPRAIDQLVEGLTRGDQPQVLLGVTGSGKTFTMAQVLSRVNRPALVMVHNKTLAAQLYQEFRRFFPEERRRVLRQLLRLLPAGSLHAGDRLVHREGSHHQRRDRPAAAVGHAVALRAPRRHHRRERVVHLRPRIAGGLLRAAGRRSSAGSASTATSILRKLVEIQYERNDHDFTRGTFRVRGDIVEVYPSYDDVGLRIGFFGDEIDELVSFDPLTGREIRRHERIAVYPKSHFVTPRARTQRGDREHQGRADASGWRSSRGAGRVLEAQRLHQRTMFDLEMIKEIGYCHGIENYSRHLSGRAPGEPPPTLLDYLPDDAIIIVDESHQTVPQVRGMYARRPVAQGSAGRVRLPAAVGARQPAAELRGVGSAGRAGRLRQRDARALRAAAGRRRHRRADHPADGAGRSRRSRCAR